MLKSQAAWKALVDTFKNPPTASGFKDVIKSWIGYDQRTSYENYQYAKALTDKVPLPVRRKAISVWLDAGGDENLLRYQAAALPDKYKPIWEAALKLTADEKRIANDIKANFAAKLDDAVNVGMIKQGREDYGVPQRWKEQPQADDDAAPNPDAKKGTPGNPFAKLDPRDPFFSFQRNTPSYFDGIMAKGEPENLDIAHLVTVYDEAFHKALSSRGAIKALQDAHAQDGQPIVKLSGQAIIKSGDEASTLIDAKSLPKDAVSADGRPYRAVDHFALKGWKFVAKDKAGNPILVKGDMLIHPDHYRFLKNELETPSWMQKDNQGLMAKTARGCSGRQARFSNRPSLLARFTSSPRRCTLRFMELCPVSTTSTLI